MPARCGVHAKRRLPPRESRLTLIGTPERWWRYFWRGSVTWQSLKSRNMYTAEGVVFRNGRGGESAQPRNRPLDATPLETRTTRAYPARDVALCEFLCVAAKYLLHCTNGPAI